jgi:hypothetical protein
MSSIVTQQLYPVPQAPQAPSVLVTDLANGTMETTASNGTQQAIRPANELNALVGSIDLTNDRIVLYDASTATHVYIRPTDLLTNRGFRTVVNLVAGNNTVNHNLGLTNPSVIVETRDNITGALISTRVVTEASNSITLNVSSAISNVRISIIPVTI